jgi:hypothetical protein
MPKKRRTTRELFEKATTRKKSVPNWYDKLGGRDRRYVDHVIDEWVEHPDVSGNSIAVALKEELGITVTRENVRLKLVELRNAKTKR